jgi:hypothetical protein
MRFATDALARHEVLEVLEVMEVRSVGRSVAGADEVTHCC